MGRWRSVFMLKLLLMNSLNSRLIAINSNIVCSWEATVARARLHASGSAPLPFSRLVALADYRRPFPILFEVRSDQTGLALSEDTFVGPIRALPGTDGTLRSRGNKLGHIWVLKRQNAYCGVCRNSQQTSCVCLCSSNPFRLEYA